MERPGQAFESGLLACVQDINELLPGLSRRYDMVVIIDALAEHMGSALRILIRRKVCDARQARLVIQHIESTAFLRKNFRKDSGTPGGPAPAGRPPCSPAPASVPP
jgi:hypothetical protein